MGIIVRQGFKSSIVSYVGVVIGIFNILILYNQFLTQEQLGLYASTLLTFPVIYMSFALLGVPSVAVRFHSRFQDYESRRQLFTFIIVTPLVGLAAFVAFYGARHPDYPDTLSAPLSSAALAIAIMAILSSTKGQMAVFFMRRLTHNILPTIILLTTGDERRFDDYQKARASASTTIAAWLMLPVISILLNIASNYIYDYFR